MKKLSLFILLIISTSAMAQKSPSYDDAVYQGNRRKPEVEKTTTKTKEISAGDYLKSAANNRLASTLTGVAGGFLIGLSPTLDDKQTQNLTTIGGIVFGIASIVTHFIAIDREYKAGEQLNREKNRGNQAYIQPAKDGLGLNITF